MTKKKLKEPPLHSIVIDRSGSAWQRVPTGWAICGSDNSWFYTWEQVLNDPQDTHDIYKEIYRDEVTVIWTPKTGTIAAEGNLFTDEDSLREAGYLTIDEFVDKLSVGLRDYMHSNWGHSLDKNELHHPEDLASSASIYTEIAARVIGDFAVSSEQ